MSWSTHIENADLDEIIRMPEPTVAGESSGEMLQQFEEAHDAAVSIISSGVMGEGKRWTVTLGGHANPGHEPLEGWANNSVSISIYQV